MELIVAYIRDVAAWDIQLAIMFTGVIGLEVLWPRRGSPRPSWESRIKAGVFWAIYICITIAIMFAVGGLLAKLHFEPLFPSLTPPGVPIVVGAIAAAALAAVIGDGFYYWFHRLQHASPLLWRFHATHHSVRELSGIATYHHFSEAPLKALLYGVPLSLFITDPFAVPLLSWILLIHGHYLHSPTGLNFGPFGKVMMDNRYHRIHHSMNPEHFNRNFGVVTPLWDWLFRTAHFPKQNEWPDTGLDDRPEPDTIVNFLIGPFLRPKPILAPHLSSGNQE